jgi:CNP1-like family
MRIQVVCLVLAGLVAAGPVRAQWDGWDYTFDREIKPWAEMQAQMPAYPKDDGLIPLDVGSATPHRFFIDGGSVSVGSDGIVRYTLVIKTAGGATNVSFEGIRCETREQKYYAIGRSDKTWVRARDPQWRRIEPKDFNAQHATLYREYLCRGKTMVESAEQIVQALRRGPSREQIRD